MSQSLKVYLPADEKIYLEGLISKGSHSSRLLRRARILLLADRSGGKWNRYGKIAEVMHSDPSTVSNICRQYVLGSLEMALNEKPRPGRAPKITGEIEARLILLACSEPPEGQQRWTLKLLAGQLVELGLVDSISEVAVYHRLKNELKPWQVKTWCIPKPSAQFVAKMEDVLDVYARPYDPDYPVVCLDEARKELLSDAVDPVPGQPGQAKREDYQYIRGGTVSLYLAVEPLAGKRWVRCTERQTRVELAGILRELAEVHYPDVKRIVLVTDNLKPHHFSALYEAFEPELAHTLAQRFEWHYTPEHGS